MHGCQQSAVLNRRLFLVQYPVSAGHIHPKYYIAMFRSQYLVRLNNVKAIADLMIGHPNTGVVQTIAVIQPLCAAVRGRSSSRIPMELVNAQALGTPQYAVGPGRPS